MTARDHAEVRLVPPVGWGATPDSRIAPRLATLDGITLGLLANGKANGMGLLDAVADEIATRVTIARVLRATKDHPSLPMSDEVLMMFSEHAHAVLTAIGD